MGLIKFLEKRRKKGRELKLEREKRKVRLAPKLRAAEHKAFAKEKLRLAKARGKARARKPSGVLASIGKIGKGIETVDVAFRQVEKEMFPEFSGLFGPMGQPKRRKKKKPKRKKKVVITYE